MVDAGRSSETSPWRFLCVGFWLVNSIAICINLANGAVSSFGKSGLPCGLRDPCVRFSDFVQFV